MAHQADWENFPNAKKLMELSRKTTSSQYLEKGRQASVSCSGRLIDQMEFSHNLFCLLLSTLVMDIPKFMLLTFSMAQNPWGKNSNLLHDQYGRKKKVLKCYISVEFL